MTTAAGLGNWHMGPKQGEKDGYHTVRWSYYETILIKAIRDQKTWEAVQGLY